jgi:beta-glucosidase
VSADSSPLFPFGHGLSYTRFDYYDFHFLQGSKAGETVDICVSVKNLGEFTGEEVVQLYICDDYACLPRPVNELKGFIRLELQPGESRRVTFHLPVNSWRFMIRICI